jgi:hypothetical protein
MILVETGSVEGFVTPDELVCADPFLRAVERNLLETVRHAEEVGDDVVVEPYYRLGWQMTEADMRKTRAATRNRNVELLFRDLYTVDGDRCRLAKWVEMTKAVFEC